MKFIKDNSQVKREDEVISEINAKVYFDVFNNNMIIIQLLS